MSLCTFDFEPSSAGRFVATCAVCGRRVETHSREVYAPCRSSADYSATADRISGRVNGVGFYLKSLLARWLGIVAEPGCPCEKRAKIMDIWGPDECEAHLEEIVGWLREEATKRGLPFVDIAGRVLVRRAISNARKEQARATQAATTEGREAT